MLFYDVPTIWGFSIATFNYRRVISIQVSLNCHLHCIGGDMWTQAVLDLGECFADPVGLQISINIKKYQ